MLSLVGVRSSVGAGKLLLTLDPGPGPLTTEHLSREDFLSGTTGRYLGGRGGRLVTTLAYGEGETVLRAAGVFPGLFM